MSEERVTYNADEFISSETLHARTCRCDACVEYWDRQWEKSRAFTNQQNPGVRNCWTCADDRDKCIVGYGSCRQNEFMFWRPKPGTQASKTQEKIRAECDSIRELLLEKNRKYGDSAINPVRIFSTADPVAQIDVRIDDKLSRIRSAQADDTEDAELDLIGYLILKRVAKRNGKM